MGCLPTNPSVIIRSSAVIVFADGTRLGTYEIISLLGTGGMGEVYRAKDLRLSRDIALKFLPDKLALDRERLSRFEQEARSASALNHPNIITIYELGQIESTHYIAMELVDGKTLRQLLDDGSIPPVKVIQIAAQIADGLAKAHDAGIIHRDLKPENLMVSSDGLVKILDFGLAKLGATDDESSRITTAGSETSSDFLVGAVQYMSPEQASGDLSTSGLTSSPLGCCSMKCWPENNHIKGAAKPRLWQPFSASAQSPSAPSLPISPRPYAGSSSAALRGNPRSATSPPATSLATSPRCVSTFPGYRPNR